ncbi:1-(5-phosphoribosyl)-5-[(5-phosphoribosylamino)methylideneamino]imidazole-4-carboxamide isomerase [Aureibacter tunicatorum]|uniref:1-(5-phosphoribosyl)-5-[(5-phosphoribosylamino)methylideneamino] imidazole-4-carboxamide isomerase n=1 Tax=Aureibacter tunicatorum TaxID=866807 RepID=A0AAE4BT62_9BACT|nr:1-(5-phosphoribosyl)-5-[(5-phosphoribosylamino)methylideneamino]imidazole-4-carboxamide isomerase [Aureibacter tunicatorum]MDR6239202.1 phosphoribosylformimino-5-aminoimidazole carboxamide ribotide isomerase [Aureibacter tunicatorum]BDD04872.1 1-(5-phosphoribosyl)-5-[(5-phosphoribosylamino) methylideneamino] imidazole-4-carboxamide isomerase [Aureibacter tunicatorum]
MYIIPAIDLIDGKCVRLTQGDYNQKKEYNSDPLEVAKGYEDAGIEKLHLVDLDGAKAKKVINYKVLELIASKTNLKIDFGGGVQSDEDIKVVFESGAEQVTGGSIAVKNEELFTRWIEKYGAEKIILGADVREEYIAISGWQEKTEVHLFDFLQKYIDKGLRDVICTDVSKDGLLMGPSFDLYAKLMAKFPEINLIASGGVSSMQDLDKLAEMDIYGAIVGKAIYEKKITLNEIYCFNK